MPGVARTLSERARAAAAPPAEPTEAPLAAMLDGLRGLVEKLGAVGREAAAAEGGEASQSRPVVFGYTIRTGLDGKPNAEPFGHVPQAGAAPDVAAPRQPITDVFTDGADVVVVAELPGASGADITLRVEGLALLIAATGPLPYAKRVALPEAVLPASLRHSCNNGILEVRLARQGTAS